MSIKTIYQADLSDVIETGKAITKDEAEKLFTFFQNCTVFRWADANNDCEDRANALCMILDKWKVQNGKSWVFSGYVFNKPGYLTNLWKYHVAALIPVKEENVMFYYVIDPATCQSLIRLEDWADNITSNPYSYYVIKNGKYYIFHSRHIKKDNWYKRNKRNYNWTMQGLSGINGLSSQGKAHLAFNKRRVMKTELLFKELLNSNHL